MKNKNQLNVEENVQTDDSSNIFKIFRKIISLTQTVILICVIILLFVIAKSRIKNEIPNFFGYSAHIVVTGSMEPDIKINDLVIVKHTSIENISIGDDVLFDYGPITIIHRVIAIDEDNKTITTHGINNPDDSNETISQIHGKKVLTLTVLGNIIVFVKKNILLVVGLAGFGIAIKIIISLKKDIADSK